MDEKQDIQEKLTLLEALGKASKHLQTIPIPIYSNINSTTIKSILELEIQLDTSLCTDPTLFNLSQSLSNLKTHLNKLQNSQDYSLLSFIRRQIANYEISKIASSIEAEAQAWIDQERIRSLVQLLRESTEDEEEEEEEEEEKVKVLLQFENRLSNGFDRELQEKILKAKIFQILESIVSKLKFSRRVCEQSALVIVALVRFNKDVFVGQVLMGPIIQSLVSMASCGSIKVISSLVKLVKSPLVYEMEANGYIPKIISFLGSKDVSIQAASIECVLELAYFATKEAIGAMIEEGLIKKLMELQRMGELDHDQNRGNFDEAEFEMGMEIGMGREERRLSEYCSFTSCVTRFVVSLEMGEGLEKREKREIKQEILRQVKEACVSEAEATSVVAEVLWGSSPLLH